MLIPCRDLRPGQELPGATGDGWSITWVAGPDGAPNFNPGRAEPNPLIAMGMTAVPQGGAFTPHTNAGAALSIVLQGDGEFRVGGTTSAIGALDAVYCPASDIIGIANTSTHPLYVMWVDEMAG